MKKQKVQLGKKVFLNKETVVALNNDEQQNALGGGVTASCAGSCVATCDLLLVTCQATMGGCATLQLC